MGSQHVETEVKLYVPALAPIADRLTAQGAVLTAGRVFERNVRYEDAQNTLTSAGRVLRLRMDTCARLTYKEPASYSAGIMSRTEVEVTVSDFDAADLLLRKLGFHPAWVYEKYRTTYAWQGCEVVLDELPIGSFVEIEGEEAAIHTALLALDLVGAPRIPASYSDLFFRIKDRLKLTVQDLTFEDFRGVTVPAELIISA